MWYSNLIITIGTWFLYASTVFVFIMLGMAIRQDIKKAKGNTRQRKITEYLSLTAGSLLGVIVLRLFFSEQLASIYYWLTGLGK